MNTGQIGLDIQPHFELKKVYRNIFDDVQLCVITFKENVTTLILSELVREKSNF